MLKFAFCVYLLATYVGADTPTDKPPLDQSSFTFAIFKDRIPVCAGALVDINTKTMYIATAAHCVHAVQNSRLFVSQGSAIFDLKTVMLVDRVIVHPYYMPPSLDYDIALLKIRLPQNIYESPKPALALNIIKVEPDSDQLLSVVSWDFKTVKDNTLQLINATSENRSSCRAKIGNLVTLSRKVLCANFKSGVVPDGGPLIFQDGLVGIASYKPENQNGNIIAVFTNIANSEIYSFIERYI